MGRAGAGGPTRHGPGSLLVHHAPHLTFLSLLGVVAGDAGFPRAFSHFHLGVIGPDVKHLCVDKCVSHHTFLPPEEGEEGPMDGTYQGACSVFVAGGRGPEMCCCSLMKGPSTRSVLNSCPPREGCGSGGREGHGGNCSQSPGQAHGGVCVNPHMFWVCGCCRW